MSMNESGQRSMTEFEGLPGEEDDTLDVNDTLLPREVAKHTICMLTPVSALETSTHCMVIMLGRSTTKPSSC